MVRRLLNCALLLAILTAFASPAYADNSGRGQGGGNGNGSSSSDGAGPGNSGGAGNSENAASVGGNPSGKEGKSGKDEPRGGKADEDLALEAVRAEDALPLKDILRELRKSTDDKVIDARLFSRGDVLVYELKVLGGDGRVGIYRYEAGSGKRITIR